MKYNLINKSNRKNNVHKCYCDICKKIIKANKVEQHYIKHVKKGEIRKK